MVSLLLVLAVLVGATPAAAHPLAPAVLVAGVEARTQIRAFLDGLGRHETQDYVCAA